MARRVDAPHFNYRPGIAPAARIAPDTTFAKNGWIALCARIGLAACRLARRPAGIRGAIRPWRMEDRWIHHNNRWTALRPARPSWRIVNGRINVDHRRSPATGPTRRHISSVNRRKPGSPNGRRELRSGGQRRVYVARNGIAWRRRLKSAPTWRWRR